MTEEVKETEVTEEENTNTEEANNEEVEQKQEEQKEKTYTESELQQMMKDRVARERKAAKKEAEKEIEEAKKLAKMNADEKEKYEKEKLEKELEEYKRKDQYYQLSREASKMLSNHDIQADDDILSFVVQDTAEDTQSSVNAFVDLFNKKVEEGVKKALSGKSPKIHAAKGRVITAEDFKAMSYPEKVQFKKDEPEKYKKLIEGGN